MCHRKTLFSQDNTQSKSIHLLYYSYSKSILDIKYDIWFWLVYKKAITFLGIK